MPGMLDILFHSALSVKTRACTQSRLEYVYLDTLCINILINVVKNRYRLLDPVLSI